MTTSECAAFQLLIQNRRQQHKQRQQREQQLLGHETSLDTREMQMQALIDAVCSLVGSGTAYGSGNMQGNVMPAAVAAAAAKLVAATAAPSAAADKGLLHSDIETGSGSTSFDSSIFTSVSPFVAPEDQQTTDTCANEAEAQQLTVARRSAECRNRRGEFKKKETLLKGRSCNRQLNSFYWWLKGKFLLSPQAAS